MLIDIDSTDVSGLHLAGSPSAILLRVFALQAFTSDDGLRIIQPGTPNAGPWYKETVCSVSGTTVSVPSLQLESQTDAFNPGETGARYYAAFYSLDGGLIAPFQPLSNFQIRHDYNPTTWPKVVAYNNAPYVPFQAFQTYTRGQVDGLFALLPAISPGGSAVVSVFGRQGMVEAASGDYDVTKITGLQAALDAKAPVSHTHDASAIVSGVFPPARLGTGTPGTNTFLRGDGTWQLISTIGSGPGGSVSSVFGRSGAIIALAGDYDIPKITGLSAALAAKADLPHFHDGSAITAGIVAKERLGTGTPDATKFLRGDGSWSPISGIGSGPGSIDQTANFTWTGTHIFQSRFTGSGAFQINGSAGKQLMIASGDDLTSSANWPSIGLFQGSGARVTYDPDGALTNRKELRLDSTGYHVRGAPVSYETSTDGTTWVQYAGSSFTGGNTAFNISATAAGSQAAGYTIGGLSALMQVYAAGLFNTQAISGDVVTQFPGKRHGFAFNAADRYSMMIDSDAGDTVANTALWLRQNGQLRRVVSDTSKVLSFGLAGDPTVTGAFLRGDGSWAVPAGTGPGGAVSSVSLAVDSTIFVSPVPGSPVTSSGTLTLTHVAQAAAKFFAGPVTGANAVPTFRVIAATDITALNAAAITGTILAARLGSGTTDATTFLRGDSTWQAISSLPGGPGSGGTVTSVGLSLPSSVFVIGGGPNPITTNGTFSVTFQTSIPALQVFATPTATSGPPSFRILTPADIPPLDGAKIQTGTITPARLGINTADSSKFLQGDGTWQPKSTLGGTGSPTGPVATIAAFDAVGSMVSALASAPADYDVGTDGGPGTLVGNIHFKRRGLILDAGAAVSAYYTTNFTCNVFYAQDDWLQIGPYNGASGPSAPSGVRMNIRVGTGSAGDGSGKGDLYLDGRTSGTALIATAFHASAHYKGYLGINYCPSVGVPFVPTAPLTVGRSDNGAELVHIRQRAGSGSGYQNAMVFTCPTSDNVERELFRINGAYTNSTAATRTGSIQFWIPTNNADVAQFIIGRRTTSNNTGLWLQKYASSFPGDQEEIILQDSTTFPGYKYLMLPA